jgi:hypothetical protein
MEVKVATGVPSDAGMRHTQDDDQHGGHEIDRDGPRPARDEIAGIPQDSESCWHRRNTTQLLTGRARIAGSSEETGRHVEGSKRK